MYVEVDKEFYTKLPHENEERELVYPSNPLRKWEIDADDSEPLAIHVKEKKELKNVIYGDDHKGPNDIWKCFLSQLKTDDYLPALNPPPPVEEREDNDQGSDSKVETGSDDEEDDEGDSDSEGNSDSEAESGSDDDQVTGASGNVNKNSCSNDDDQLIYDAAHVYAERKQKEGKKKDKICLSIYEFNCAMTVMSAADSMREDGECFEMENKKGKDELVAVPLRQRELGTTQRILPNPNPSRPTNIQSDTLIRTNLKEPTERTEQSPQYPLRERLKVTNNKIDDPFFVNHVFQSTIAAITSDPATLGAYLKENNLSAENLLPDLDKGELDDFLFFVQSSLDAGSKWSHHQHGQFTESVPEKVRKDFPIFRNFIKNYAVQLPPLLTKVMDEARSSGLAKPDRLNVLRHLQQLLSKCSDGTKQQDWTFLAGQVLSNMDDLYEDEPLGEADMTNTPAGFGADKGAKYLKKFGKKKNPGEIIKKREIVPKLHRKKIPGILDRKRRQTKIMNSAVLF